MVNTKMGSSALAIGSTAIPEPRAHADQHGPQISAILIQALACRQSNTVIKHTTVLVGKRVPDC